MTRHQNLTIDFIALGIFLGFATVALAANHTGQRFIKDVVEGNLAEVQIGELAQRNGQSDAVKSYGQMLVTDHTEANQKATAIAKRLGVTPPTEPNAKQKATYDKLSKLTGADFDRAFANEMVADHKKDIGEFKKEAAIKNDPAAEFASKTLPTLQKHLDAAQKLTQTGSASR
jgi:putative membrane protein